MSPSEDISTFDELRRYGVGAMSVDERARFEARLRSEPELARMAALFQEVWSATEPGVLPAATSRTSFDDLASRLDARGVRTAWRRWRVICPGGSSACNTC